MKRLLLAGLLLTGLSGCTKQTEEQKLVSEYVRHNTNDPSSYESVSFGEPRKLTFGDMYADKPDNQFVGGVLIEHTFRAKNRLGALVIETEPFVIDGPNNRVQTLAETKAESANRMRELVDRRRIEIARYNDSLAEIRVNE